MNPEQLHRPDRPSQAASLVERGGWRYVALLFVVLVIVIAVAGFWLMTSSSGLRWLGAAVSQTSAGKLSIEGLEGELARSVRARAVRFIGEGLIILVRDVQLDWTPGDLASRQLTVNLLSAREVEIVSLPSSEPASLPENLELPLSVAVHKLDIGALRLLHEQGGTPAFTASALAARMESDGHTHRVVDMRAGLEFGNLTAAGSIEGMRPFAVLAEARLAGMAVPELRPDLSVSQTASLSMNATGSLEKLDVAMTGSGAGLKGRVEAQLQPYAPFVVAGLSISAEGFNPRLFSPTAPAAGLTLEADLRGNATGQLEGDLAVRNDIPKALDQGGVPLLQFKAHPVLSMEELRLDGLTMTLPGNGTISGRFALQVREETAAAELIISRVNPARLDTRMHEANLSGSATIGGDAEKQRAAIVLKDKALLMDVIVLRSEDMLTLEKAHLRHGRSALAGKGTLGLSGSRDFAFDGSLRHFDASAFVKTPRTDLNATLGLVGELASKASGEAAGTVRFKMENSRIADHPVFGHGQIEFAGATRAKGEVELSMGSNRLVARGGIGRKGDRLQLELAAPALAQLGYGLSGSLAVEATVDSRFANLRGDMLSLPDMTLRASGSDLALPGEHRIGTFSADGKVQGDVIDLTASMLNYGNQAETRLENLKLEVAGSRVRHGVRMAARLVNGQDIALRAEGTLADPTPAYRDAEWTGELSELSGTGRIPFQLGNALPLSISARSISAGGTKLLIAGGSVEIGGFEWSPERWRTSGRFSGIRLRPGSNLDGTIGGNDGTGSEFLRLGGDWNIDAGQQLKGTLNVGRESGDWVVHGEPPFTLGLQILHLSALAADGKLIGELKAKGMRLGEASATLTFPLQRSSESVLNWTVAEDAPLAGHVLVDMEDISWAGPALDSTNNIRMGGALDLRADVIGTFHAPRLRGHINGADLAFALLDQGVRFEQGKLAARFDEKSLHLDALDFIAPHLPPPSDRLLRNVELAKGPGRLSGSGVMDLTGERGNLEIAATLVPLAQRPDRWIIASGNGQATLENNRLTLRGKLTADAGLLAQPTAGRPHLPDDVVVVGLDASSQQAPGGKGLRIDMEAALDLGERFYIRASGLEGRLAGQLSLRGEPGERLRATGTITARDTSFEAYGQRLTVERGIVSFQGPLDDPGLNVLALRKGLAVVAGVEVTGSVRHPRVRLVSTPHVSDLEKLSWIALGRAPGGKTDASLLLAAAGSILGGQSGGVTEKISQALGVDELSIRQAGSDPLMGQIGTIGKRLSKEAYISYEQGLTAAAGITKLTYALTPRITVVARAGMDNAIDVFYSLRFD